jgi:hypothetical protein
MAEWWTFGILIFEMINGAPVFFNFDRLKMFEEYI